MEDYHDGTWEEFEEWIRKTIAGDFRWKIRPQDNTSNREMVAHMIENVIQDGLIERLESGAARLYSVSDVRDIAREVFECEFSWFDHCDPLVVEGAFPEVRVFYVCTKTSSSEQLTFIDCRFHFDSRQMWIGSIQVAACHRLQGVGRQLVRVAEAIANALGMEEVRILPTPSSVDFWLKMRYVPDPRSARVLWKNPANVGQSVAR